MNSRYSYSATLGPEVFSVRFTLVRKVFSHNDRTRGAVCSFVGWSLTHEHIAAFDTERKLTLGWCRIYAINPVHLMLVLTPRTWFNLKLAVDGMINFMTAMRILNLKGYSVGTISNDASSRHIISSRPLSLVYYYTVMYMYRFLCSHRNLAYRLCVDCRPHYQQTRTTLQRYVRWTFLR